MPLPVPLRPEAVPLPRPQREGYPRSPRPKGLTLMLTDKEMAFRSAVRMFYPPGQRLASWFNHSNTGGTLIDHIMVDATAAPWVTQADVAAGDVGHFVKDHAPVTACM